MPIQTIDAKTLKHWLHTGEAVLVDVREPGEHEAEHISYMLHPGLWHMWLSRIEQDGRLSSLRIGGLNLMIGSFIVAFHPIWTGIPVILSVIGAIALAKGIIYLLFPQWLPAKLSYVVQRPGSLLRITGLFLAIFGFLLLDHWMITQQVEGWPEFLTHILAL